MCEGEIEREFVSVLACVRVRDTVCVKESECVGVCESERECVYVLERSVTDLKPTSDLKVRFAFILLLKNVDLTCPSITIRRPRRAWLQLRIQIGRFYFNR